MSTEPGLILAQWFSPGYPVGAFAYSHGLETAIAEGRVTGARSLAGWVRGVLTGGAGRNDAILLAATWRGDEVGEIAEAVAVSAERLHEAKAQGAAFAKVTAAVWGIALAEAAYPVAVGHAARALELPLPAVLRHYLLAFAANLVSAGVRAIPIGQTEGQAVLAALAPDIEALATEAEAGDCSTLGGAAMLADIASMRHEVMEVRIFRT